MIFNIIICVLVAYDFQSVQCKAWPDQFSYNNSNQWGNPYYRDTEPTTSTPRPLYPTLYPQYRPNDDIGQRQEPFVQPFQPLQPNIGDNSHHRNRNHNHSSNDYSNNNFDYPFDNTRTITTYPPFRSTMRNTFPTRRNFNTLPTNNPTQPTYPSAQNDRNFNQHPDNRYNPSSNPGNNYQDQNRYNSNNNNTAYRPFPSPQPYGGSPTQPNNGNPNQNRYNPSAPSTPQNRPFPNPQVYDGRNPSQSNYQPYNGNSNQNNSHPSNPSAPLASQNQPFPNPQVYDGRNPSQSNYQPYDGNSNLNNFNPSAPQTPQSRPFSNPQTYDGRNPHQSNYQPNNGNSNQASMYPNTNMNQNSYNPSANHATPPTLPDVHPSGVALAPFPDSDDSNPNNLGARKNFNYDNLYHRYPKSGVDSRFDGNDGSKIPLASYGGSQVPLAPF